MARVIQLGDYQLRVLNNDEFDMLPYKDAEESVGMALKNRNTAFIRETGLPEIDEATMEHELQELLATVSPHEENGIRYKKAKQILGPVSSVLSFVPGPWQPFAMAYSLGAGVYDIANNGLTWQNALQVAPGALGAFKGFAQAGAGFGSKLGGALKGSVGIGNAAGQAASKGASVTAPTATPSLGAGTASQGAIQGAQAASAPAMNVSSGISKLSDDAARAVSSAQTGMNTAGMGQTPASGTTTGALRGTTTPAPTQPTSLMDKFAAGAKEGAKNIGKEVVKGKIAEKLIPASGRPVAMGANVRGTGALEAFAPQMKVSDEAYAPAYGDEAIQTGLQNIIQNAEQRKTDAFDMFRRINPGSPIEGNTAFVRTLSSIDESTGAAEEEFLKRAEEANVAKHQQDTYSEIKRLNNLTDEGMQFYIDLAQKPDEEIRPHVASDIGQFKEVFGSLKGVQV